MTLFSGKEIACPGVNVVQTPRFDVFPDKALH